MEGKNFERELPEGYKEIFTVDASNKKLGIIMNLAALVIAAVVTAIAFLIIKPTEFFESFSFIRNTVFVVSLFAYIVLHELTHGVAYEMLTHEKLTFGMTLTVAYCGVPNIYVYRRTALIALLAPFVTFTVIFGALMFLLPDPWSKIYAAVVFGLHVGGCIGDLYDTYLYLTKFKDPSILMKDTGPKQTFYAISNES